MRVEELLAQVKKNHPEQADIIDAFTPLAITQESLKNSGSKSRLAPWNLANLPINTANAVDAAEAITEALSTGFPDYIHDFRATLLALRQKPSPIKALCKAALNPQEETSKNTLQAFAKRHDLAETPLQMLLIQVLRAMAAQASQRVNAPETTQAVCPCCGSAPDMSIIFEKEGVRYLHCSLCSHTWRFTRTACPFCATDKADNLVWLYEENRKEERAVKCSNCQEYILEIDARPLQIDSPALAYYASLGMNHLDALAQE